jgi:DNA-binding transcriptional LysR family regulator
MVPYTTKASYEAPAGVYERPVVDHSISLPPGRGLRTQRPPPCATEECEARGTRRRTVDHPRNRLDDTARFRRSPRGQKIKAHNVMEIGSREAIREAVIRGLGISYVSEAEFVPDPALRMLPIADAEIYTYAHVVVLQKRNSSRIIARFSTSSARRFGPNSPLGRMARLHDCHHMPLQRCSRESSSRAKPKTHCHD